MQLNFSDVIKNGTLITGGHFMLTSKGANINPGTIASFQKAAQLLHKNYKKYKKLGLGILVNDIGAVCSASGCSITPSSIHEVSLPIEYLNILKELELPVEMVHIFQEKHIRNRGKKWLMQQIAKGNNSFTYAEGEYIYQPKPSTKSENCPTQFSPPIILTRKSSKDKHGTPACPLIMCAYALEQKRLGFKSSLNFYYVGEDNYLNIANHFVIEKGKFLAEKFEQNFDVKNVYLFHNCTMQNFKRKID